MEPTVCFQEWLQAVSENNWDKAQIHFQDLHTWLKKGGSPPIVSNDIFLKLMLSHRSMAQIVQMANGPKKVV